MLGAKKKIKSRNTESLESRLSMAIGREVPGRDLSDGPIYHAYYSIVYLRIVKIQGIQCKFNLQYTIEIQDIRYQKNFRLHQTL